MKKVLVLLGVIIFLLAFIWKDQRFHAAFPTGDRLKTIHISGEKLRVEVTQTPEELSKGLGERDAIGSDGMLFLLPVRVVPTFWMKGMRFGLDFVWINEGKVVALTPNVPPQPGVPDASLKTYSPGVPTDTVLEIPEGGIAKRGLKVGDTVY